MTINRGRDDSETGFGLDLGADLGLGCGFGADLGADGRADSGDGLDSGTDFGTDGRADSGDGLDSGADSGTDGRADSGTDSEFGAGKRLVVIVGPTGSGKTDLSIGLAQHLRAPILSTDSRQLYRGMAIGTAQPSEEQLQLVEHHFIASHDLHSDLNCGQYAVEALERLECLFRIHDQVVAVGGSGLYVRALCEGMDELPKADPALRATLTQRLQEEGLEALAEQLRALDPTHWQQVDRCNPARVVRALEVCLQTGRPYSELRLGARQRRPFAIRKIGIDLPRAELYERIDRRVEQMLAAGLEAEARALYPHRALNALQTVGYREFFDYFDARTSYADAVEAIKRNSRHYAKRQLTWFRRDPEIRWFAPSELGAIVEYLGEG